MDHFLAFLLTGLSIGATLSFIPSPLLALLVSETLKYGKREGIVIALIPILTDIPIIILCFLVFSHLTSLNLVFGIISCIGFLFLFYIGIKGLLSKGIQPDPNVQKPNNLKKGLMTNLLNPSPYIFWITVATPVIVPAFKVNILFPIGYVLGFLCSIVGVRIGMAFLVEKSKRFFSSKAYLIFEKIISILLIAFGIKLLIKGIDFFKLSF